MGSSQAWSSSGLDSTYMKDKRSYSCSSSRERRKDEGRSS